MISATEAKKNWIIANIIIGFFLTANESIWTCKAQNIDPDVIERMVTGIVRQLESTGETDIPSNLIGSLKPQKFINLSRNYSF